MENIGTMILATGALGTAAFGIVESLKWTRSAQHWMVYPLLWGTGTLMLRVAQEPA